MSNRSRGAAFELRCKKILESQGFHVDKARAIVRPVFRPGRPPVFVSSANDFMGCADLLAVHRESAQTWFVQCTVGDHTHVRPRRRKMELVPWNLTAQRVEIWQRVEKPRGVIRIHRLHADPLEGFVWKFLDWHSTRPEVNTEEQADSE